MTRHELIVVGGGTSGCWLTRELAGRFAVRVTLVEPASQPARSIDRERPARWLNLIGSAEDYHFRTEPSRGLASRRLVWPRGRGIGGSGRINAMIYLPPTRRDRQRLATFAGNAAPGVGIRPDEEVGPDEDGGPGEVQRALGGVDRAPGIVDRALGIVDRAPGIVDRAVRDVERVVRPEAPRWLSDASVRFLEAAEGYPGAAPLAYRRFNRGGRRWTPAELLDGIPPARTEIVRGNVDRLVWDGDTAAGVVIRNADGESSVLRADRGVVLAAGAIGSPAILMRSGVGAPDRLREAGIDPRIALPGVGENLQDHLIMPVVYGIDDRDRFCETPTPADLARWQAIGAGPVGSNLAECGGLFDEGRIQLHVTPTDYLRFPHANAVPAMTIGVNATSPRSRGRLEISSADPDVPPTIHANYVDDERDLDSLVRGIEIARDIAQRVPLRGWLQKEKVPGRRRSSRSELGSAIGRYAQTLYHPAGTCAAKLSWPIPAKSISPEIEPSMAVVDERFGVIGSQRLWVVDASVFPRIPEVNPSVALMTLATLAARVIANVSDLEDRPGSAK